MTENKTPKTVTTDSSEETLTITIDKKKLKKYALITAAVTIGAVGASALLKADESINIEKDSETGAITISENEDSKSE